MLTKANYFPASSEDINYNELYDLEKDPNELNNLYGQPGYEKITEDLKAELVKLQTQYKDPIEQKLKQAKEAAAPAEK